jgi:NADH:ubiquinone oxidoreductase subunit C
MAAPNLPAGAPPIPVSTLPPAPACVELAQRIEAQWKGKVKGVRALNPLNPGIQLEKNVVVTFEGDTKALPDFWKWARDQEGFDHCSLVVAIDHMDKIEVKHLLFGYAHHMTLETSVTCDRLNPEMPSAALVWRGANWLEREQFDLMGVKFVEHPDLRRVLLPEDWIGHPLRKDYEFRQAGEWW